MKCEEKNRIGGTAKRYTVTFWHLADAGAFQTPFIVPGIGEPMGVGFFGDLKVSGNGYSSGSSSSLFIKSVYSVKRLLVVLTAISRLCSLPC